MTPGKVVLKEGLLGTGDIQMISDVKQIFFPDKSKRPRQNFINCLTRTAAACLIFAA
jgi:hypothetical protein